jgi:hypothetical protein
MINMRYTEIELQCEDLLWFAVDLNGNIIALTSGGAGCVPEFVACSKENNELLINYFDKLKSNSKNSYNDLANKGLYYFDVSYEDNYGNSYIRIAIPDNPINIVSLPSNIQKLLSNNKLDIDVSTSEAIKVKHAY